MTLQQKGLLFGDHHTLNLSTNGRQAWSQMGSLVGSYHLSGGRALAGTFHDWDRGIRLWRREVATTDGSMKAILLNWYRGGHRIGTQQGILTFNPS